MNITWNENKFKIDLIKIQQSLLLNATYSSSYILTGKYFWTMRMSHHTHEKLNLHKSDLKTQCTHLLAKTAYHTKSKNSTWSKLKIPFNFTKTDISQSTKHQKICAHPVFIFNQPSPSNESGWISSIPFERVFGVVPGFESDNEKSRLPVSLSLRP